MIRRLGLLAALIPQIASAHTLAGHCVERGSVGFVEVPQVSFRLENEATGDIHIAQCDASARYSVDLDEGRYLVVAEIEGYARIRSAPGVIVIGGEQSKTWNLVLNRIADRTESVHGETASPLSLSNFGSSDPMESDEMSELRAQAQVGRTNEPACLQSIILQVSDDRLEELARQALTHPTKDMAALLAAETKDPKAEPQKVYLSVKEPELCAEPLHSFSLER